MVKTPEESILSVLMNWPEELERNTLEPGLFSDHRHLEIIKEIRRQYEDKFSFDLVIAAQYLTGKVEASYLSGLLEYAATYPQSRQELASWLSGIRVAKINRKIVAESKRIAESELKTGVLDDEAVNGLICLALEREGLTSRKEVPNALVGLDSIEAEPVSWLWRNHVPLGRITFLAGDPGSGKTWILLDWASRLSRGLAWPDGATGTSVGATIYMSLEDSPADTLRPRVDSLGGDPRQVHILNPLLENGLLELGSQESLEILQRQITRIGNVRLVAIDPVVDFSGGLDGNRAEEVRGFLNPLAQMAERGQFALVLISHLSKAQANQALYRVSGSASGWVGKARAAFLVFRDREEPKKRYFHAIKANLSPDDPGQLAFRIIGGRLEYERPDQPADPEDHIGLNINRKGGQESGYASEWLREQLKDGPMKLKDISAQAEEIGIPRSTLFVASKKIGVISRASGRRETRSAEWSLPSTTAGTPGSH